MDDYFYRVSEPEYVPEPEIIGDPGDTLDGEGIAGTSWDFPDTESSMIFYEDGTGAQTSPWDSIEFEYTWDGETVEIFTDWIRLEYVPLAENGKLVVRLTVDGEEYIDEDEARRDHIRHVEAGRNTWITVCAVALILLVGVVGLALRER